MRANAILNNPMVSKSFRVNPGIAFHGRRNEKEVSKRTKSVNCTCLFSSSFLSTTSMEGKDVWKFLTDKVAVTATPASGSGNALKISSAAAAKDDGDDEASDDDFAFNFNKSALAPSIASSSAAGSSLACDTNQEPYELFRFFVFG